MNCAGCDKTLLPREHAQPITFQDRRYWPKSACDTCCRDNIWPGGSLDALDRLSTGLTDAQEAARVYAATSDWLAGLHEQRPSP